MKRFCIGLLFAGLAQSALAAGVAVQVSGVASSQGQVGCLIFDQADGFPKVVDKAIKQQTQPAAPTVTCTFVDLSARNYAIAVNHDKNSNNKVDTNLLGIPKEEWGVSNNVRFKLRAPTFKEAQFSLTEGQQLTMTIEVAK